MCLAEWVAGDRITTGPDQHLHRWGRYAGAIARWEHITGRPAPTPALLSEDIGPRPSLEFVEWLMGFQQDGSRVQRRRTPNQQTTALGSGGVPGQAAYGLRALR